MKLLLDENLSRRLVSALQDSFAGTRHLEEVGLQGESDVAVWQFAGREDFVLVSKDDDFRQISLLRGAPPKVIVLAIGNAGNAVVLHTLTQHSARIDAFVADAQESLLVLRSAQA